MAKKFAEEVSTDWLGMDIGPIGEESVGSTCENIEPQIKLNENEKGLDDSAISAVSNDNSESTSANNSSDQESEIKTPLGMCLLLLIFKSHLSFSVLVIAMCVFFRLLTLN